MPEQPVKVKAAIRGRANKVFFMGVAPKVHSFKCA
jgi:hypothetical protein